MDIGKCLGWWEGGSLVVLGPGLRMVISPCWLTKQQCDGAAGLFLVPV